MGFLPLDQFLCWKLKVATVAVAAYVIVSIRSFFVYSKLSLYGKRECITGVKLYV